MLEVKNDRFISARARRRHTSSIGAGYSIAHGIDNKHREVVAVREPERIFESVLIQPFDSCFVGSYDELSEVYHNKYLFVFIPQRGAKKAHRHDGLDILTYRPIVLPLAPYLSRLPCGHRGSPSHTLYGQRHYTMAKTICQGCFVYSLKHHYNDDNSLAFNFGFCYNTNKDVFGCGNMRFIGCKTNLLNEINSVIQENCDNTERVFCDLFSGTGTVSRFFKPKYQIISNDMMYFSHILTAATIENNQIPEFKRLREEGITDPLTFLEIAPIQEKNGYITETFSPVGNAGRMYFIEENAERIDFIRDTIEIWKQRDWINQSEYKYLLACLIEGVPFVSNITGTYGAYLKTWDKRALKRFELQRLDIYNNSQRNICYNEDANDLIRKISGDILYIDPPYNERQYLPNYHVLETIARNDKPVVFGKTGLRDYSNQKSKYCNKSQVYGAFEDLIANADFKHIIISYSNDGLLSLDEMLYLLNTLCIPNSVKVYKINYNRYKSKIQNEHEEHFEYLFYARKKDTHLSEKQLPNIAVSQSIITGAKKKYIKSPMNYIGGKYKLLPQLINLFPDSIDTFVDLFAGSFTVTANVKANKYVCNDINYKIVEMVRTLCYADIDVILARIHSKIQEYGLSKTNTDGYNRFREFYNANNNPIDLFTLSCFSFNYQFRFNNQLEYNNPFGKNRSQYSAVTEKNLIAFVNAMKNRQIEFFSRDFRKINSSYLGTNDFVYCDPPYLITTGCYNDGNRGFKDWKTQEEKDLLLWLDDINVKGIKFALSNLFRHNGKDNKLLIEWAKKYNAHTIDSDYSNCNYQLKDKSNADTVEVLITNY